MEFYLVTAFTFRNRIHIEEPNNPLNVVCGKDHVTGFFLQASGFRILYDLKALDAVKTERVCVCHGNSGGAYFDLHTG